MPRAMVRAMPSTSMDAATPSAAQYSAVPGLAGDPDARHEQRDRQQRQHPFQRGDQPVALLRLGQVRRLEQREGGVDGRDSGRDAESPGDQGVFTWAMSGPRLSTTWLFTTLSEPLP